MTDNQEIPEHLRRAADRAKNASFDPADQTSFGWALSNLIDGVTSAIGQGLAEIRRIAEIIDPPTAPEPPAEPDPIVTPPPAPAIPRFKAVISRPRPMAISFPEVAYGFQEGAILAPGGDYSELPGGVEWWECEIVPTKRIRTAAPVRPQ